MGLLDFGANVILKLKADTSDAKAKLKELSGEERKLAESRLAAQEAENKSLEKKAKNWQMAAQAVGAVTAAYVIGSKGLDAYAKTSRAAAKEVEKIQTSASKAFDGVMASIGKVVISFEPLIAKVVSFVELLNDAGVAGPAAISALAFAISGNPLVAGAIGLLALGMQGPGIATDMQNVVADPTGDKRTKTAAQNALGAINRVRGNGAMGDKLGDAYSGLGAITKAIDNGFGAVLGGLGLSRWNKFENKSPGALEDNRLDPDNTLLYGNRQNLAVTRKAYNPYLDNAVNTFGLTGPVDSTLDAAIDKRLRELGKGFDLGSKGLMDPYALQGSGIASAQESQLAKIFGPVSEFNIYTEAFSALSGAVGSALDAWITGSASAADAFKAFIGEAVKGIAIQMAMEALKHGAYAIGSLAMGNFAGAALHGKAAAGFAAGAIVAATAAKGLASGGSSGPVASASYSPNAPSSYSGSSAQPASSPIIVYGDSFAEDAPHERQLRAEKMIRRAMPGRQFAVAS